MPHIPFMFGDRDNLCVLKADSTVCVLATCAPREAAGLLELLDDGDEADPELALRCSALFLILQSETS